ncbi:MAG: hypothetical protein LQ344_003457 [Seirophora lacunosa]|nr:MAG: hypothetical protein LQ344_003457 [Seirophora lacunosa]
MSSTQASSPLSQILSDIEDIIELRMALCRRWATSDHHPFISVDWMDFQLQEKIDEAGRRVSTAPPRRAKCMTRMLNIQNELCIEQFRDLPHEMGLVIERLKVVIEDPLMSRPLPHFIGQTSDRWRQTVPTAAGGGGSDARIEFMLSAYGSETRKAFGDDKDLRLVWKAGQKVFHCYKSRYNQATVYANLELVPDNVERFIRSKDGNKVLIESAVGGDSGVPLFLQLRDGREVKRLFITLLQLTEGYIEHEIRGSEDVDQAVAEYE